MKKIIIWGINVIVIILTVFLVSCIIRNNANRSNDIKTQNIMAQLSRQKFDVFIMN